MFAVWVILGGPLVLGAPFQDDKGSDSSAVATPSSGPAIKDTAIDKQNTKAEAAEKSSATSPGGIGEIEKMVAAGISKDVIRTYIENVQVTRSLSAAEIISLKEHAVPDEITTALLKRAAEIKAQARQAGTSSTKEGEAGNGYLDRESYDFWWHHYAYPRTLASSYRTLYSYRPESYGWFAPGPSLSYGPVWDVRLGSLRSRQMSAPPFRSRAVHPRGFGPRSGGRAY